MPYAITPDGRTVYIPKEQVSKPISIENTLRDISTLGSMAGKAMSRVSVPMYAVTHPFSLGPSGTEISPGKYESFVNDAIARSNDAAIRQFGPFVVGGKGTDAEPFIGNENYFTVTGSYPQRQPISTAIGYQPQRQIAAIVDDTEMPGTNIMPTVYVGPNGTALNDAEFPTIRGFLDNNPSAVNSNLGDNAENLPDVIVKTGGDDVDYIEDAEIVEGEDNPTTETNVGEENLREAEDELEDELEAEQDIDGTPIENPAEDTPAGSVAEGVAQGQAEGVAEGQVEGQVASPSPSPNNGPKWPRRLADLVKKDFKFTGGDGWKGKAVRWILGYLPAAGLVADGIINAADAITRTPESYEPVLNSEGKPIMDAYGNIQLKPVYKKPTTYFPISQFTYGLPITLGKKLKYWNAEDEGLRQAQDYWNSYYQKNQGEQQEDNGVGEYEDGTYYQYPYEGNDSIPLQDITPTTTTTPNNSERYTPDEEDQTFESLMGR